MSDDHQPYPPPPAEPPGWPPVVDPTSPFGPLAPEGASGPDTVPGPHRPKAWMVAGLMISALAVIGVATWVGWTMLQADGPSYPEAWDPRVEDIATFVEDERDLDFLTPVHVDFLTEDEFREQVTTSEDDLTDEDRRAIEDDTAQLRALGLVKADLDLFEEQNDLTGDGVGAFYDPVEKRITVRGTELTPRVRATIAHELTHALQDQHFDLQQLDDDAGEDGWFVYLALIEGDATTVEGAYMSEELTESERAEAFDADAEAGESAYADVAQALVAYFIAPYQFGPQFVATLRDGDGDDPGELDYILRNGLPAEVALFDPRRVGDRPVDLLPIPELDDGQELLDDGSFGAFSWFVVLASRVDPRDALEVVDQWKTDSYVTYDDAGTVCVKARFEGVSASGTDEMERVLGEWAATMPTGTATVEREADHVQITSCDPGADADVEPPNDVLDALQYPVGRLAYAAHLLDTMTGVSGEPPDRVGQVWCQADALFDEFTLDELAQTEPDPELTARAEAAIAESC